LGIGRRDYKKIAGTVGDGAFRVDKLRGNLSGYDAALLIRLFKEASR
jgi:hypothetical protein